MFTQVRKKVPLYCLPGESCSTDFGPTAGGSRTEQYDQAVWGKGIARSCTASFGSFAYLSGHSFKTLAANTSFLQISSAPSEKSDRERPSDNAFSHAHSII